MADGEGREEGVSAGVVRGRGVTVLSSSGVSLGFGATLVFGEAEGFPPVVAAGEGFVVPVGDCEGFAVAVGAGLFL